MASQTVEVLPADRYEVRFLERDGFSGKTAGYHFKQLLIDGNVVWEQDVAGGPDGWQKVVVDVTAQVRGKAHTTLWPSACWTKRGSATSRCIGG